MTYPTSLLLNISASILTTHNGANILRYTDHKGHVHHIRGTTGGQQGDPLEMLSFCLTIHPIWGRVMSRHPNARAVAFADDGFVHDTLQSDLHIWAELCYVFKEDARLVMQITKCKLFVQGAASLLDARTMVRECIDSDPALSSLLEIFDAEEGKEVIQIEGIKCVCVPIGTEDFVHKFVAENESEIMADVEKLKMVSDPLIHFHLLRFCQNTFFSYLSRHVPPPVMLNPPATYNMLTTQCNRQVHLAARHQK
jgi:hypothetical protein